MLAATLVDLLDTGMALKKVVCWGIDKVVLMVYQKVWSSAVLRVSVLAPLSAAWKDLSAADLKEKAMVGVKVVLMVVGLVVEMVFGMADLMECETVDKQVD